MTEMQVINPSRTIDKSIKRIAAYCRVSSDSDDQQNSFINQVHTYTEYINSQPNMELVDIYADEGITGTAVKKRDEFMRMMRDCKRGKIDRILCKSVSRFARNTMDCLQTTRKLKSMGISVLFEKENIDTLKMTDEILITIMSSIAQSESSSISKNLKMMNRNRMEKGEYISRMAPYGYIYKDRTYVIDKEKAEVVKRIFCEYLSGYGVAAIANRLNDDGIAPNDNAERWHINTIYKILRNEKYVGDTLMQKTFHEDCVPFTPRQNKGELAKYYVYETHTPILPRETFEATQELLKKKHRGPNTSSAQTNPLYQMIKCGTCGATFKRKVVRHKAYWVCYNHNIHSEYCGMKPISEESIQTAFTMMFEKLRINSQHILVPAISLMTDLRSSIRKNNVRIGEIDKRLAELNEKKHLITKLKNKGFMDDESFRNDVNEIDNEVTELRKERKKQLDNEREDDSLERLTDLQTILSEATVKNGEFDAELFHTVIEQITIADEDTIKFVLLGGLELSEHLERCEPDET